MEEDEAQQDNTDNDEEDLHNKSERGNEENDAMNLNNYDISDADSTNIKPNNVKLVDLMNKIVISLVQDRTLDLTKDNHNTSIGFLNTNLVIFLLIWRQINKVQMLSLGMSFSIKPDNVYLGEMEQLLEQTVKTLGSKFMFYYSWSDIPITSAIGKFVSTSFVCCCN